MPSPDIERLAERALKQVDVLVANELHVPTDQPLTRAQMEVDFWRLVRQGCWTRMQTANKPIWDAASPLIQSISDAYAKGAP